MCRGEEPATRCRAMERVIAGVSTPCPFLQHGCTDMVPYTEKHSHEASCAHAPCLCPIAGCAGRAGVKSLRDHLMADHEEVTLTRVRPGRLTPVKLRACVENGGVACIIGSGAAEFLLAVGHGHGVPAGRTLSLLHLKDASQLVLDDGEEFMYRIEVVGESAVLSLSGQAEGVVRLRRPYQAREFLFVPDAMWGSCSGEVSVLIELKRSEDSV